MANPNFIATMSSNEIWRDLDDTRCITDDLDAIEANISELEEGKADANHTHSDYAPSEHTHNGYANAIHGHSYNDLNDKPTIPSAYSHPENHPASMITGLATVATTGNYDDLNDKPTIPVLPFTEDTAYPGCFYRVVDGATEWINPPMAAGVEYRTTERYKGDVVYVKHIAYNCPAISATGTYQDIAIAHGISNYGSTVRANGVYKDNSNILPYFGTDKFTAISNVGANSIVLRSINKDWVADVWNFTLYYTKS